MNEGYASWNKLKTNSLLHGVGENNLQPQQTINSNQSEEALAVVATMTSLLSHPNKNSTSMNISHNSLRMKCYFHNE